MIYRLSFGVPQNLLRLLANGLVIGKILAAAPAAIPLSDAFFKAQPVMKPNFHFMVSEVSLGLNQCRINFGMGLDCIEPVRLLITARKPYLRKYRQKLDTALASPKIMQMT